MIYYCPHCWKEIDRATTVYPYCGRQTSENGVDFVAKLLSALRHPEPTRAGLAIDILAGKLHEPRAVGPLIELMNTAFDPFIRAQAARGLGLIGDRDAIPSLAQVLSNPDAPLSARCEAACALGRIGGEEAELALSQAFSDPRASIAEAAWEAYQTLRGLDPP